MVFGKLFGDGEKKRQQAQEAENFRRGLEAPMRALLDLIHDMPVDRISKMLLRQKIIERDRNELERVLQNVVLPKLDAKWQARIKELGKSEAWMTFHEYQQTPMCWRRGEDRMDLLELGKFPIPTELTNGQQKYSGIAFDGDGHLLTVAPTGSGKGQGFIIRNLYHYQGPTVVFDPKGELYRKTAWRRDWYGKVFKFAPEDPDTDCFNPMDMLTPLPGEDADVIWDNGRQLAELMIEPMGKEPFWDNTAKDLMTALIFYVYHTYPARQRNIREVTRLLYLDGDRQNALIEKLQESDEERLRELGASLLDQHENMRTSITHTLRTQLEIWRSGKVMRATRGTSHGLHPHTIAGDDHMRWWLHAEGVEDKPGFWLDDDHTAITGDAHTVFVVVPPEQISVYRSVLRVVLGMMLQGVMAHRRHVGREARNGRASFMPEGQWPFLFLFDELPQLGYMRIVEDAVSIARGANIRLWLVAQDLSQLRNVYPRWETLVANSKAQMYFRPNDLGTARYISDLLGEHPDLWGNRTPLAAPHELMGDAFRDDVILRFQGHKPIRARMPMFWDESESVKEMVATAKAHLGDKPAREKEPWPVDGLTLDELNAQNAAMRKQVPEPASSTEDMEEASEAEQPEAAEPSPDDRPENDLELSEDGLPKPPKLE